MRISLFCGIIPFSTLEHKKGAGNAYKQRVSGSSFIFEVLYVSSYRKIFLIFLFSSFGW